MEKYLRHYAEPEVAAIAGYLAAFPQQKPWHNVVVIPACNESDGCLRSPPPCDGRSLLILVVNESSAAAGNVTASNHELAKSVERQFKPLWKSKNTTDNVLSLYEDKNASRDVLLIDRFSAGRQLPVKGGVGLARKIGCDLAVCLFHHKRIKSPWIHCTDADVHLPATYFQSSQVVQNISAYAALIYPFTHSDSVDRSEGQDVVVASRLYELSLRYYVAGMKYAGSPYAFHTIGSTIAINASHYVKVRGFPKREAGEDFYLLNKLAKVGKILELGEGSECQPIEIESRRSDRVPFGTGAAVRKIADFEKPVEEFRFYDPAVFEMLRLWLLRLPAIWKSQSLDLASTLLAGGSVGFQQEPLEYRQELLDGLNVVKTGQALAHAFRQSKSEEQFTRQMHTWFDAFRTLKLIHHLRDTQFPSISYIRLGSDQRFSRIMALDKELSTFHKQNIFSAQ